MSTHRFTMPTLIVLIASGCTEYEIIPGDLDVGFDSGIPALDTAAPDEPEPEPEEPEEPEAEEPEPTDPDLPVAVCEVSPNPVSPPFESATWNGTDSYDPNGLTILDYEWTLLTKPVGSTVAMPFGDALRGDFTPDLAGDYTAQLVVTNEDGVASEPCETTLESVPAESLWVEMFWISSGDDMDLHLLAPGGQLESQSDCYWANCTFGGLDWGDPGNSDDPSLDLDDIENIGPENINIQSPESGIYTVVVHDYPTSNFQPGNDVTVNIYLAGALVWTDTRTMSGEDTFEEFAEIDWAAGEVNSL